MYFIGLISNLFVYTMSLDHFLLQIVTIYNGLFRDPFF